jgi:hypothetical protein
MADKKKSGAAEKYVVQHTAVSLQAVVDGETQERLLAKGDVVDAAIFGKGLDRMLQIGAITPYYGASDVGETDMDVRAGVPRPEAFAAIPSGIVNSAGRDDATGQPLVVNRDGQSVKLSIEEAGKVDEASANELVDADKKSRK